MYQTNQQPTFPRLTDGYTASMIGQLPTHGYTKTISYLTKGHKTPIAAGSGDVERPKIASPNQVLSGIPEQAYNMAP